MAPTNANLIRPIYEEWSRGNWRPCFDVYHPRMEWGWSDEFPGLDGVFEDLRDPNPRLQSWLSGWEHWRVEVDDFLELGDHVVALVTYHGRGKSSGVEVRQQGAHVFELRAGQVVRLEIFANRERAMDALLPRLPIRGRSSSETESGTSRSRSSGSRPRGRCGSRYSAGSRA